MQANTDTTSPSNSSMTFKKAKNKLVELAAGMGVDYVSLFYEVSLNKGKLIKTNCMLYYYNGGLFSGRTWEEAFDNLDKKINPPKLSLDGAPE